MKALVLSGGGGRGAFQVGVLKHWLEKDPNMDYDMFVGTSVGAINASVLANLCGRMSLKDAVVALERFWRNDVRSNGDIYRFWPGVVPMFWRDSVYDTRPLAKILERTLVGKSRSCWVAATNVKTGDISYFSEKYTDFHRCVLASASFPIFFPTVDIDGQQFADGAIVHNIPLGHVIRNGATEINLIAANNPYETFVWDGKQTLLSLVRRTLDIMTEQMTKSDLEATGFKNDLADLSASFKKVVVQTIFFAGSQRFDALDFDGKKIDEMIDMGYDQALDARVVD